MGEVYRAEDLKLGRTVALKLVLSEGVKDENARQRLWHEAKAASSLNHPNIVTIHALEQADGLDFFVMEYVEGESLSKRLERGALPLPELLDLGVQLADSLASAHERKLLHRDIKPSNIVVTPRGQMKLLDFGLAKGQPQAGDPNTLTELTQEGAIAGTVAYMSPEQARGEPLDGRSDLFSVGTVLYEASTGTRPFHATSALMILHQIATADPPPPSSVRPELPREFDLIVARALAKNREQRCASAAELRESLQALRSGGAAPAREAETGAFVGREPELKRLESLLERAASGSGKIVFITGEPGIGKTELASRFVKRAAQLRPGLLIGRGRCVEQYGTGEAYLPFLDAVGSLLNGPERGRVMTALRTRAPTWCLQFPAVFASTGDLEQLRRETIGATKERMLREMGDALAALAASSPVALLLEDIHWADPSSTDLLRHLSERAREHRLLVIGTFRPEDLEVSGHALKNYKHEMQAHQLCEEIPLGALTREHIEAYLNMGFAPNDFPPELADVIQRKTEGHALFATGLIQYLAERGEIAKTDGRWKLARRPDELDLEAPESVRGMIGKKIGALEEEERRLLQYASIEGEEFTSTILARLLESSELTLEERLDGLEKTHGLVRMIGEELLPDGAVATRYRFAHGLYQNVFYATLLPKRRSLLHRQAGEELLRRHGAQAARIAVQLAMHFEQGRDLRRAIDAWIQAGDNAASRYDNTVALEHYGRALGLSEQISGADQAALQIALYEKRGRTHLALVRFPQAEGDLKAMQALAQSSSDGGAECRALLALADTCFWSHRIEELGACAAEALRVAKQIGDEKLRSEALVMLTLKHLVVGALDGFAALIDEAIVIARALDHKKALVSALRVRGLLDFFQSEYKQAMQSLDEGARLAAELGDGFNLTTCLFFLGVSQANMGRISEALATLNQTIQMSRRNGNRMNLAKAPNAVGWIYREMGDMAQGIENNEASAKTARELGVVEAETNALVNLTYDYLGTGGPEKALAALERARAICDRDPWFEWRFNGIRSQAAAAEYWIGQGDLEQAAEYAGRVLQNAARSKARKYIAIAHQLLADIASRRSDAAQAERELMKALEALQEHPTPLVAWKVHASLARLRLEAGDAARARQEFSEAASIIRDIADSINDDRLQTIFLSSPAVREVLAGA